MRWRDEGIHNVLPLCRMVHERMQLGSLRNTTRFARHRGLQRVGVYSLGGVQRDAVLPLFCAHVLPQEEGSCPATRTVCHEASSCLGVEEDRL